MKFNTCVSSSRRKTRKAHFTAPSHERRVIMSAPLSKRLRQKYGIRSLPIRKNDEVVIKRGRYKTQQQQMRVIDVKRAQYVINCEKLSRDKSNGTQVPLNIHPSNVEIVKLYLNGDRQRMIERKTVHRFKAPAAETAE